MRLSASRSMQRLLSALLLAVVSLSLTACGSKGETVVHVKLTEYAITLDRTSVPAGPIKFEIQNAGTIGHELVLEPDGSVDKPFDINGKESEAENIGPGQTATLEWTLDTSGTYELGCHTPGHYEQGMFTTFQVTAK